MIVAGTNEQNSGMQPCSLGRWRSNAKAVPFLAHHKHKKKNLKMFTKKQLNGNHEMIKLHIDTVVYLGFHFKRKYNKKKNFWFTQNVCH